MRGHPPRRRVAAFAAVVVAAACLACGGPNVNPTEKDARAALDAALEAWRAGKKPTDLATAATPVNVVDGVWTNGRELADYQVLQEVPSEADKRFKVKLVYDNPASDEEVVYIILGAEARSVFRSEDYDRTMNMDNNPTPKRRR